jgi:preprotein translocase subunit YajC
MFITPAYAQATGGGGGDIFGFLIPLVAMIGIFYFLVMRPQQKKHKQHAEMVANVRRGDTIVTNGGLVGKVSKVSDERELLVELAQGVKVKVVKDMISQVRVKGEPAEDEAKKK